MSLCNAHETGGKVEPGRHTSGAWGRVLIPVRKVTGTSRTQTGAGGAFREGQLHIGTYRYLLVPKVGADSFSTVFVYNC